MARSSQQHRVTKETTIELTLEVDGAGTASASTGMPNSAAARRNKAASPTGSAAAISSSL